jgi:hypothetical protein
MGPAIPNQSKSEQAWNVRDLFPFFISWEGRRLVGTKRENQKVEKCIT